MCIEEINKGQCTPSAKKRTCEEKVCITTEKINKYYYRCAPTKQNKARDNEGRQGSLGVIVIARAKPAAERQPHQPNRSFLMTTRPHMCVLGNYEGSTEDSRLASWPAVHTAWTAISGQRCPGRLGTPLWR